VHNKTKRQKLCCDESGRIFALRLFDNLFVSVRRLFIFNVDATYKEKFSGACKFRNQKNTA